MRRLTLNSTANVDPKSSSRVTEAYKPSVGKATLVEQLEAELRRVDGIGHPGARPGIPHEEVPPETSTKELQSANGAAVDTASTKRLPSANMARRIFGRPESSEQHVDAAAREHDPTRLYPETVPINRTGLPDDLKHSIEQLSGVSLDSVRVHYNSLAPAAPKALAYTQGTDIYVAPGQEAQIGHEAWHAVQQLQGRVHPIKQSAGEVPINDDFTLEAEADVMAAKAASMNRPGLAPTVIGAKPPTGPALGSQAVRQYRLQKVNADSVATPGQIIKQATGVAVGSQVLTPGSNQPANTVERPREVSATIDKGTLRDNARAKDSILSNVTAMARAEQRILQGADMKKFFDAGHLVGDQLVAGDGTDSFEYWNLAPQVSSFNTPAYSGIEDKIRTLVNPNAKPPASSSTISMTVQLEYPDDYQVSIQHLKARKIVTSSNANDSTKLTFPRRIPSKWIMRAVVSGSASHVPSSRSRVGSEGHPTLGDPFAMNSKELLEGSALTTQGYKIKGTQWFPSTDIQSADILSLLSKTFTDLGAPTDIAKRILDDRQEIIPKATIQLIKEAAGDVALAQMDVMVRLIELKDPSVLQEEVTAATLGIHGHLNIARAEATPLWEAVQHLVIAKNWVDALLDKVTETRDEQNERFLLSLSQQQHLHDNSSEAKYATAFESSVTQPALELKEASPMEEVESEKEQPHSKLIDFRGKYQSNTPTVDGGELIIQHWGPPGLLARQPIIIEDRKIVYVREVTSEHSLFGAATGRWIIRYLFNSDS